MSRLLITASNELSIELSKVAARLKIKPRLRKHPGTTIPEPLPR